MSQPFLSIIIPAYKEEKRIHKSLEAILAYEKIHDFSLEVIVVSDGSPDNQGEVVKEYKNKFKNLKYIDRKINKGKGYTVKEGVLAAEGKYILFTDADNSTPIKFADRLLKGAKEFPVVIGSRYSADGKLAHPQGIVRRLGSRCLNLFIQLLAVPGIRDTQCGFKMFQNDAGKEIFKRLTFERFSFDIEILAIARYKKYKIKEVGITWYDDPHSTVSPIKDGLKMIRDSWRTRMNLIKGVYK